MTTRFFRTLVNMLSLCMILVMLIGMMMPFTAETVDGEPAGLSGSGSINDPYRIETLTDLELFRDSVNSGDSYTDKYVKLLNDVTMNEPDMFAYDEDGNISGAAEGKTPYQWAPIGNSFHPFSGTFDGNGHQIIGIYINSKSNAVGLMSYCEDAAIKSLGMVNGYVSGNGYVGSVVGSIYAHNGRVTVADCYQTGTVTGSADVGGIIGYQLTNHGTINVSNCSSSGTVTGNGDVGGVIGHSMIRYGTETSAVPAVVTVTNCINTGTVTGVRFAGGVVGYNENEAGSVTVSRCTNTGAVSGGRFSNTGGIVGNNSASSVREFEADSTVTNCYNTGAISGGSYADVGGIVGRNYASNRSYADSGAATVMSCYNTGRISGYQAGGIAGENIAALNLVSSVTNCYYLEGTAAVGCTNNDIGEGTKTIEHVHALTDEQMQDAESFAGFDFDSIWTMDGDPDYPYPELIVSPALIEDATEPGEAPAPESVRGDADGDRDVSSADVTLLQRYLAEMDVPVTESDLSRCDIDGDGELAVLDVTFVQWYLAEIEIPYPIG